MRAAEISARLANAVEPFVTLLLPAGVKDGAEWCVGSVNGDAGKSLKVRLTGPKAGIWQDFATGEHGDLLDLWRAVKRVSISQAMHECADWLGVSDRIERRSSHERPALRIPSGVVAVAAGTVMTWLTQTRKLPLASIHAYRIAERSGKLAMPAFDPDGKTLRYMKYRAVPMKEFSSEAGAKACLFGWQAIPRDARSVVLAEGELDCVAWHAYGYPALSPTNGASSLNWIEDEFESLNRFDTIYVAYDDDDAGHRGAAAVSERLGADRCRLVKLPAKDANDALMAEIPKTEIDKSISEAQSIDPPELVHIRDFRRELHDFFRNGATKIGIQLPWQKAQDLFAFGPGELTILAGATGDGKSELANLLTLEAMHQGLQACVASMEFTPERYFRRISVQSLGVETPTDSYLDAGIDWIDQHMVAFGKRGTYDLQRIIDVFTYAARRYGCRWFVVDNMAKCGIAEDDYKAQKELVDRLGDFANDHRAHVVLCVHVRKGDSARREIGINDVKGTGAISDMADNVALIRRNRKKEAAEKVGNAEYAGEPDTWLSFEKVRDGDCEPSFALWFRRECRQFIEHENAPVRRYVPEGSFVQEVTYGA